MAPSLRGSCRFAVWPLREWLLYSRETFAGADVADSRHVLAPAALPISPDLTVRFDTVSPVFAGSHTVNQNPIPPLLRANFRRELRTGARVLRQNYSSFALMPFHPFLNQGISPSDLRFAEEE